MPAWTPTLYSKMSRSEPMPSATPCAGLAHNDYILSSFWSYARLPVAGTCFDINIAGAQLPSLQRNQSRVAGAWVRVCGRLTPLPNET
jgi:hypothetical protein